jgi:hypothetical protein
MGPHQMRHEGRQLRRRVDQTIWRLLIGVALAVASHFDDPLRDDFPD